MSIVIRGLQQGLVSRGLGGTSSQTTTEENGSDFVDLKIESHCIVDKLQYPITGTFAGVKGWQWSKSIPQNLQVLEERIESSIGGYEWNLEEGAVYNDWLGACLSNLELKNILKKQDITKREKFLPQIETGSYSIFNFEKSLFGDNSYSKLIKEESFLLDEDISNYEICVFKRDSYFNNIPFVKYKYSDSLEEKYSYFEESGEIFLSEVFQKQIGNGEDPKTENWEFCGIGNENRSIIYPEFFPCSEVRLKELRADGSLVEWIKTDKFSNEELNEFIVDENSGRIYINSKEKITLTVKEDLGNEIKVFEKTDKINVSGKLTDNTNYLSKSNFSLLTESSREPLYNRGDEIKVLREGNNFKTGSEIYISYSVYPRIDIETKESLRTSSTNLKPWKKINSMGILEISPYENSLAKIKIKPIDKTRIGSELYKTLYIQSDSALIEAEALSQANKPLKEIEVKFYSDRGVFNGDTISPTKVTNLEGIARVSYSQPYERDSLSEYVTINHVGTSSNIKLTEVAPGASVDDFTLFQVLKTDPYFGSLGNKKIIERWEEDEENFYFYLEENLLDWEEYLTYQVFDANDNATYVKELCPPGKINYGFGFIYFNNSLISKKIIIKDIEGEGSAIVVDKNNLSNFFFEEANSITLYKKNELVFDLNKIKATGRSFDRVMYYNDEQEYKLLKPTRLVGDTLWFDNVLIPKAEPFNKTNLIGAYKIFSPKINSVWAEGVDPATGRVIRSNTIKLVVDFPEYLKGNKGFKLKEDLEDSESALGGSNFITINPKIENQINFMI